MEKLCGPGPQLVDHCGASPRRTLDRGSVMTSPELNLMAAPRHHGSLAMTQQRERSAGSPSRASQGREQRRGNRATTVRKWRCRRLVQAALGHGEKRRRTGRGVVEDGKAGTKLTRAQEAVRWPGDDSKAVAAEELGGGGARAQRGEEESGDGCREDWARALAFYRGRREAEASGIQWPASMPGLEDAGYSE
jgi:hypothetical protein